MKWKIAATLLLLYAGAFAQVPPAYPTGPLPAGNIVAIEYFFDSDPGVGMGNAIPVTPATTIQDLSATIALTAGALVHRVHTVGFRSKDINGQWSLVHYRVFDNIPSPAYPVAPQPAGQVVAVEYFIDVDPGVGNGIVIPVTAAGDIALPNVLIDVTGLSQGIHQVFFRARHTNGQWSLTHMRSFNNLAAQPYPVAPPPAPAIGDLEYFIDVDPGPGNGTAIPFTPSVNIVDLPVTIQLTGLTAGEHTLFIRSRQNPWSLTTSRTFNLGGSLPLTWLYFNGKIDGNTALLNWGTTNEIDVEKFVVEHAVDGLRFEVVGQLPASNQSGNQNYSYLHERLTDGIHYYRIRQVDLNGRFTYSKVLLLLVKNSLRQDIAFPNPANQFLNIALAKPAVVDFYEIVSMDGRVLKRVAQKGQVVNLVNIGLTNMAKGNYSLRLYYDGRFHVFPFMKE